MKISKIQIAMITVLCVLLLIILSLNAPPRRKPAIPASEQQTQEQTIGQVGKYELPQAQESVEYQVPQTKASDATSAAETVTENTHNDTDGLNSEEEKVQTYTPDPSLPKKPPKLPPPEQMEEMRRRGIVAY